MKVAIIGSGNVATILGRLICSRGHSVVHVAGRNAENAAALAKEFACGSSVYDEMGNVEADIYILAVSDDGISSTINQLKIKGLIVHTAGSVSKDVLRGNNTSYGVLYPLQSLRKEMSAIPDIPFLIDGSDHATVEKIGAFASTLSGNVQFANDDQRLRLHAAAVIVSNFTNHLYTLADDFCNKENVDFKMLLPLIKETAVRISYTSPSSVQTGPALRGDIHTLDKHLRLFTDYPKLRYLYLKLTDSIMHS